MGGLTPDPDFAYALALASCLTPSYAYTLPVMASKLIMTATVMMVVAIYTLLAIIVL